MSGKVFRVGNHGVSQRGGRSIGEINDRCGQPVHRTGRESQVAVIRDHRRLVHDPTAQRDSGCIELWQVQADDVVIANLAGCL